MYFLLHKCEGVFQVQSPSLCEELVMALVLPPSKTSVPRKP